VDELMASALNVGEETRTILAEQLQNAEQLLINRQRKRRVFYGQWTWHGERREQGIAADSVTDQRG
jgi:hypothetical protein